MFGHTQELKPDSETKFLVITENPTKKDVNEKPSREYVWADIYQAGRLYSHPSLVTYIGEIAHDDNGFRATTPKEEQEITTIGNDWLES